MSIYRGSGGSGDANSDATVNEVTELVQDALGYKNEAATSASNAATSASNAATSESNASTSETNASSSASDASTSETNAATSETNAATSATSASTSATSASTSATAAGTAQTAAETAETNAETAETNASASATSASSSASTATTQAGIATTKAGEASTSATNAATSETSAGNSATSASTSATSASSSASTASTAASNASTSASNASTSETNAAASAASASSSASSATSSASSAAGSASTATTKASEASTSASNASTSETNASNSASAASTSATNAATSESNAATSETNAASSASAAATSASEAAASAASIDVSGFVTKSNNLSDLNSASTALTNLGIANHDDITVDGSGNVGIGTSALNNNKAVIEGGVAGTNSSTLALKTGSGTSSQVADLAFYSTFYNHADTNQRRSADITSGYSTGVWGTEYLAFGVGGAGDASNVTTERMRIDSSGNVGIGTSSPRAHLHLRPSVPASDDFNMLISQFRPNIVLEDLSASTTDFQLFVDSNYLQFRYGDASTDTKLANEAMRIDSSGNVGIGTNSPSTELDVDGTVTATSFSGDGSSLTGLPAGYADSDALSLFNVSGSAPVYASRAWVNFNGTGTVAIRASGNVSGITDNGTGNYTVNFTTAMVGADYAISLAEVGNTTVPSTSTTVSSMDVQSYSSTALTIRTFNHLGSANDTFVEDIANVFVTVHGN